MSLFPRHVAQKWTRTPLCGRAAEQESQQPSYRPGGVMSGYISLSVQEVEEVEEVLSSPRCPHLVLKVHLLLVFGSTSLFLPSSSTPPPPSALNPSPLQTPQWLKALPAAF